MGKHNIAIDDVLDAEMTAERRVQTRQPQQNRAYMPLGYLKFANPLSHKTK